MIELYKMEMVKRKRFLSSLLLIAIILRVLKALKTITTWHMVEQ